MPSYQFTLNGQPRSVDAPADAPLLYVLRDQLALSSPRYGCGQEQCGACRVMVNEKLISSCTMLIEDVHGTRVVTVEGLTTNNTPHPLQTAFLECNAAQCGYCTSGILMSSYALLARTTSPSRTDIQQALDDNLCRCGAHNRIIRAVQRAAEIMRGAGRD